MVEVIALLTAARELGFEAGQLFTLMLIYVLLDRSFSKKFNKLIDAIKSLENSHNKRLENLENDVSSVKKKIEMRT